VVTSVITSAKFFGDWLRAVRQSISVGGGQNLGSCRQSLCFCTVKGKWFELLAPNLVDMQCMIVTCHGIDSEVKRLKVNASWLSNALMPSVCMSKRLPRFSSHYIFGFLEFLITLAQNWLYTSTSVQKFNIVVHRPSVLWHCWFGGRKGIRPVKNWVVGCYRGCVWGEVQICIWPSWCHCHSLSLAPVNPDWYIYLPDFTFLVPAYLGSHGQNREGCKTVVVVVV